MLAIGNGAEQEILAQMKLLGANNIVITPIVEQTEGKVEKDDTKKQSKKYTPGSPTSMRWRSRNHPDVPRRAPRSSEQCHYARDFTGRETRRRGPSYSM